jgi:hypothetical protein
MECAKSLSMVSEYKSIVQTIEESAEKTMPIAEKLNNALHTQIVLRWLNSYNLDTRLRYNYSTATEHCLDKSFLPCHDKPTTLKV